ncbi:glycosyltransferase family 39 protein [Mycobacterium sp. M1]|uniref:Glycosyltransferase family 39 protein n=1 Tax=Mycolicibacter acidiphilus TaxID=2835306 RepID=A0ABS5RHF9_9MYCO|nr:glycosyltransferase family 39 protein [Mycolicibacter acidiphilus]MBS9533049.1 glycosyltransferase family 39 protein [Mycolicibacter acidiphilus]
MSLVLAPQQTGATGEAEPPGVPRRRPDAVLIAVLAVVVSGVGASRPSMWFDEAATISASTQRSLPELWRLLTHIDAVHGLYYLLMHGWFAVFPVTEFWSRLPSCLAVGVGAAGTVTLAGQFAPRRVAVCAGVLYAVLPRMTWAGIEARPYAFAAMAAVWTTVLCVTAARRNTVPIWLGYGLALVLSTVLNTFTVLLVPVHAVLIRVLVPGRAVTRRWTVTAGTAVAALIPFLVFGQSQIRQIGWLRRPNWHTVVEVVQQQYFDKSVLFAVLAAAVLLTAAVAVRKGARPAPAAGMRQLAVVCTAWITLPTTITVLYSALAKPVYYPRYLICTAPAMAIALALAVTVIVTSRRSAIALTLLFTIAAIPNYVVVQRDRYAKEGWDYSPAADVIATHAAPGDCLLIDNTTRWAPGPIRALPTGRADAFAKLSDPGRGPHRQTLGRLWDGHYSVEALADDLDQCPTIWTITDHDRALPAHQAGAYLPPGKRFARTPDGRMLHQLGFHAVERWQFTFTQVIKAVR